MENDISLNEESFVQESDPIATTGENAWLPIALGVAAIFVGAAALYLSIDGSNRAQTTHSDVAASQEQIALLKEEIQSLQTALEALDKKNQSYEKQMRSLTNQAQTAINQLGNEVTSTQRQVSSNYENLGELAAALKELKLPAQPQTSSTTQGEATSTAERSAAEEGVPAGEISKPSTHTIEPGDTFGALARTYGVPLSKIIEANPETDPNRLQIGQLVNIP